ncbi:MAG: YggS family pyridoxal phosphate-dependent enzyme, partial [Clostridia bacterium]|nr:YggS family pyridoxal phosphate-dependent enzyme [Clostridia bacterium]
EQIKVVAVTKGVPVEKIRVAVSSGITAIGENRVQELVAKQKELGMEVEWHLVGHLQRNKVKYVVGKVALIHSVDSLRLAWEIDRRAQQMGTVMNVLLQVNVSGEETKYGVPPGEALDMVDKLSRLAGIKVVGLMTMAPEVDDPEQARPVFRGLKRLADEIGAARISGVDMGIISMGMSNDFEVAIEEGATLIRVGRIIFGLRK